MIGRKIADERTKKGKEEEEEEEIIERMRLIEGIN
jgi:hypothetical protein